MKRIGAAEFKEKCLALLDEVDAEGIIITKRGKPVARLVRVDVPPASLIGSLGRKIRVRGDIVSTGIKWDAVQLDVRSDPADEIIGATSVVHRLPLLTRDRKLRSSKVIPLA